MADVLANGYGTLSGTVNRTTPAVLLSSRHANFVTLTNADTTNWLFAKDPTLPDAPYAVALPGGSLTVAHGPQSANNVQKIVGFATTPNEAGSASLVAVVSAIKTA